MTSKMYIVLRTWFVVLCPFFPQQSSQNVCIFRVAKIYFTTFGAPFLLAPMGTCSCPLPIATGSAALILHFNHWIERLVCSKCVVSVWCMCQVQKQRHRHVHFTVHITLSTVTTAAVSAARRRHTWRHVPAHRTCCGISGTAQTLHTPTNEVYIWTVSLLLWQSMLIWYSCYNSII